MYRRAAEITPLLPSPSRFGIRSRAQLARDAADILRHAVRGDRFAFNVGSAGLLRPDLSLPAYAGLVPDDGVAPIFNFFDRTGGGKGFRTTVTRSPGLRDHRGGRLSYDEHDGTDFVCPPGTPLVAAAPGIVVALRDNWLRGGLTACVDHGDGVVTQYTHLLAATASVGQRVERGEPIARSGTSGADLFQFFPWIPPHIHFMVWVDGRPVDPYLADGEPARAGTWLHANDPHAVAGALPSDPSPSAIQPAVDAAAVARLIPQCHDERIRDELLRQPDDLARAAVLEDSLHHERDAWPLAAQGIPFRLAGDPTRVRLTLPLPADLYHAARAADTPWTRPRDAR